MSKKVFYVGVDVGQDELWVAIKGKKAKCFRHTKYGVKSMYNWVKAESKGSQMHFCMEATGVYSESLAYDLIPRRKVEISIVNPLQIKSFGQALLRRTKTDAVDAQVILDFARAQKPSCWEKTPKAVKELRDLVNQLDAFKADLEKWSNRGHSQKYMKGLHRTVKSTQRGLIRYLEQQIARLETAIKRLCGENEQLDRNIRLLCTIPGIAFLTAIRLLAFGKHYLWNCSPKALTAHAGLAPCHRQSGKSLRGKSHISKKGNHYLRRILFMPTQAAIRCNPQLNKKYDQFLENGKPKMLAITACMRKLLLMAQTILKKKEAFNPDILPLT